MTLLKKYENEFTGGDVSLRNTVEECKKLLNILEKIENTNISIHFLTVDDMVEITGFSRKKVLALFNDPEFPSCNYGKKQIAELSAVINYFSVPRRKEDSVYWQKFAA